MLLAQVNLLFRCNGCWITRISSVCFYRRYVNQFTSEQTMLLAENGVVIMRKAVNMELLEICVNHVIDFFVQHHRMPSREATDKMEKSIAESLKRNRQDFTPEQKQRLLDAGVPAQSLEKKKSKVTINPQNGKHVLKQCQKDDLQNSDAIK